MAASAWATVPKVVVPTKDGRPPQPAERVLLVARVLGHARHGQRVQCLEQQRADAADQHGGEVGVDPRAIAARWRGRPRRGRWRSAAVLP